MSSTSETRGKEVAGKVFQALMDHLETVWPFDKHHYPAIPSATYERNSFVINHCLLHMQKSAGNIAQYPEKVDHGKGGGNYAWVKQGALEQVRTALRLAKELGISGEEVAEYLAG